MAEAQDQGNKPNRNWGAEIDGLRNQLSDLKKQSDELKGKIVKLEEKSKANCVFCKNTGCELDRRDRPMFDAALKRRPCRVCQGRGRV